MSMLLRLAEGHRKHCDDVSISGGIRIPGLFPYPEYNWNTKTMDYGADAGAYVSAFMSALAWDNADATFKETAL